jgi:hypothetical protein
MRLAAACLTELPDLARSHVRHRGYVSVLGRLDARSCLSWNHSVVPLRPRVVRSTLTAAACLLAAIAVGGCTSSASSTPAHGSLTDEQFNVAVAVARAEIEKYTATVTSATATVGAGTVTDPNAGPACTSGTLLHIKLIGTFPTIVVGGSPTGAPGASNDYSVTAVLITADPESGKPCDISVQTGSTSPDPGAALLFTH